jgi:hypothetical protein
MRAYLLTTATLFGGIALAHVWRVLGESSELAREPFFVIATIVSAALCLWACRLLRARSSAAALVVALLLHPAPADAQSGVAPRPASVPASAPTPAHERLTFFEGTWTVAEMPLERAYRERCAWMEGGRRHMICRARSRTATGESRESLSMFSYQPSDSSYLYYGLRPGGAVEQLKGRAMPDGWTFFGETGSGPSRERKQVTITRLSNARFRFIEAVARGDAPFAAADSIHYVPAPD